MYDYYFLSNVCDLISRTDFRDAPKEVQEWFNELYSRAKVYMFEMEMEDDADNAGCLETIFQFKNTMQGEALSSLIWQYAFDNLFHHPLTDALLELVNERDAIVSPLEHPYNYPSDSRWQFTLWENQ